MFSFRHTVYASYLGYVTQAVVNNLTPLLFLTFQRQFGLSLEQIASLVTVNFTVQLIVDGLSAKFVDRIGYRACAVTAHALCTAGLLAMGLLPGLMENAYMALLIVAVCNGVAGGLIEVIISPIVEALPNKEKAGAMSLLHSFYCWGHVAVVVLSTLFFVTAGIENWAVLPLLWAAVPFVTMLLFCRVPLRRLVEDAQPMKITQLLRSKTLWLFLLLMICAGASEQAMSQWASLFAESGLGVSKTVGDLLGPCAFAVAMGLSRLFYARRGARLSLERFMVLSMALCIASYALSVFAPLPAFSLVGCAACGFSVGILWPGVFSLASRRLPVGGTAMFALLALGGDIGCAAGPGLVGIVSDTALREPSLSFLGGTGTEASLKIGLLCAAVFPLIMLIAMLRSRRGGSGQPDAVPPASS